MKALVLGSFALLLSGSTFSPINNEGISSFQSERKESMVDKTFVMDFDGIRVSSGIDAEIVKSDKEKIVITAPADIMEKIRVEKRDELVSIGFKPNTRVTFGRKRRVTAKIYARDLNRIEASSSGNIVLKDKFTQKKMTIKTSSSGDIIGNVEANDLAIKTSSSGDFKGKIWAINLLAEASSSGDINISGKATNATMKASSSGDIIAKNFVVDNLLAHASSSGDIIVGASKVANAKASSGGDIKIIKKGNLRLTKKASSGGSVIVTTR